MVSPSKIQHQEHKQPPRENLFEKHSHVRIQKGSKPLEKKSFYLDIKNHATAAKIEAKIKDLGGVTELFLVRSVSLVVSDRVDQAGYNNSERRKWGCVSGGSGGIPSLRSLETPTPMQTPPTPFFSSECPLSNSTNLRGQTAQRSKSRVDAMLERALIQPQQCSVDPLDNAHNWGIPIWAIDKLQAWLDKIYASFKDVDYLKRVKRSSQHSSGKDLKVRHFKGPYIKFESFQRNTRPVFLELPAWPTLNFHSEPGSCPFNTKRREKADKSVRKEVKENREDIRSINKEEDKEMTRRPRTAATRTRRTEQLASGYCEICRVGYRDLSKHVQTDQHLNFVRNDDNFLSLDTLINAGANVEAFLKLNRTKDIEKDCNLFPNGDRDLHEVVLPDDKVSKSGKGLDDFGVEDIKMVQCNGARRNLNLKLSSPHNLRTRAKHESGHLLRSKGSPWHEVDKSDKFYDKFEGFTIKKRAKGTIWIEEDEAGDEFPQNPELKGSKEGEYKIKQFSKDIEEICNNDNEDNVVCNKHNDSSNHDVQKPVIRSSGQNGISNVDCVKQHQGSVNHRNHEQINGSIINGCTENTLLLNDNSRLQSCRVPREDASKELNGEVQPEKVSPSTKKPSEDCERVNADVVCNGHVVKEECIAVQINKAQQVEEKVEPKDEKLRGPRSCRRGGRSIRGRHRLSVEERLIEDNRAYYKVEVLGSKLRSSVLPNNSFHCPASKDAEGEDEKKEVPSSEKPVVVRFKRVRKSELSLLSDEAESFMFGEPKRDDSSEISDGDQSSVLPKDTESEWNDSANSFCPSSPVAPDCSIKAEIIEEDSQDSLSLGRARKRRRTQAEALIMDNTDYYKFETPGSRLRYQAPFTGIKESIAGQDSVNLIEADGAVVGEDVVEKVYPSKPSAEVEKMQFSFEAVPMSESWYQTYQRQDEGAEFWHYFSEGDTRKPFLLPYEIDNFHEILLKNQSKIESRRRGRGRSIGCIGRSPRKSPRCHASTLAIMSTIIRKKEQQTPNLYTIEECQLPVSPQNHTPRPDQITKPEPKSDVDEELREMVKTIDEMLNADGNAELNDSFEPDPMQIVGSVYEPTVPKGPPQNLVELLENCHEIANCLENSSCASSECGEGNTESPLKRRKKRKNRTGWPGIKMKKKLQSKPSVDAEGERENLSEKDAREDEERLNAQAVDVPSRLLEETSGRITQSNNGSRDGGEQLSFSQWKDEGRLHESCSTNTAANVCHDGTGKRSGGSTEITDGAGLHSMSQESVDSAVPELCSGSERTFALSKDYEFRKNLSEIEEISENDPGNDENHENVFRKDVNSISITERRFISKTVIKKRQRENTSTDTCEPHTELENHDILCRKDTESRISQRKHHNSNGLPRKRQQKGHSVNSESEIERNSSVYRRNRVTPRKRIYSRKRTKKNNMSSETVFEVENCKKDSYLSITCGKQQQPQQLKGVKRRADAISSEAQDSELECALAERVSPTVMPSSDREQRQSSIDFQPVVRMMKIDDQVDMDHSILSVTVASNRRLRSSSSPRSNAQPPKKRLKASRGQFSRWLKSS